MNIDTGLQRAGRDSWILKFSDLMPFLIREILLVSSRYDAFILEEDGPLSERIIEEYTEFNLSFFPRITHCSSGKEALKLMKKRRFDIVITVPRLEGMHVNVFGKKVKEINRNMPVVALAFDQKNRGSLSQEDIDTRFIDNFFLWTGDARILFAIIKLIEDGKNVKADTRQGKVRVIVCVEDSIRTYSSFLPILYSEIVKQSHSVIADALNELHKLTRMRSRPKVLLATSYEKAKEYINKYKENVQAVISDIRFPKKGKLYARSGFDLTRYINKTLERKIPILLQSAEKSNKEEAQKLGVHFVNKRSEKLQKHIRNFLKTDLGFGDFIFQLNNQKEVGRATNLYEMEKELQNVPDASIEYHAQKNDFSTWLTARSMFILAEILRDKARTEFTSTQELRNYLVEVFKTSRVQEQRGIIADFSLFLKQTQPENVFIRIGSGSIGGKGRGLAFVNSLLMREDLFSDIKDIQFKTPKTVVISSDEFDRFIDDNFPSDYDFENNSDEEIKAAFIKCELPSSLVQKLKLACSELNGPLAVRSSGLLEDSEFLPFAGIYSTFMIPNNNPDPEIKYEQLFNAIKTVYASTFLKNAKTFIAGSPYSTEDEKMAIIIQEIVGQNHNNRFYPQISGVAMSFNYYPIGHQKQDEGIVQIALGLGQTIVQGGKAFRFCPKTPQNLPQFSTPYDTVRQTQSTFFALDLKQNKIDFIHKIEPSLKKYSLSDAEEDNTLQHVGSVFCVEDNTIRETFNREGPRVVTFNNILKWNAIPLASALDQMLKEMKKAMGCPIEIEFAVDIQSNQKPAIYILQIRPFVHKETAEASFNKNLYKDEDFLCKTEKSLGHGLIDNIKDIVYVKPQILEMSSSQSIAKQVGQITKNLIKEKTPYIIIGPGRWGSSDPSLGIPVEWSHIAGAKVIAETNFIDKIVEPSQGTHFFQNITSLGIGYLTVSDGELDQLWLNEQKSHYETNGVRHLRLKKPIIVYLDGKNGHANILKPGATEKKDVELPEIL